MILLAAVFLSGWLGHGLYSLHRERQQEFQKELQKYKTITDVRQKSLNQNFVAEWKTAAPVPEWWDEVQTPAYNIENVGNLLSAWQSEFSRGGRQTYADRQFLKRHTWAS
jgi:hypothetical protein